MIITKKISLIVFMTCLSLHLGLALELPPVGYSGAGLALIFGLTPLRLKRPTWGLIFIMLAAGGMIGYNVLDEFTSPGSWVYYSKTPAGACIALLVYLIWLMAVRSEKTTDPPFDRDTQTILMVGTALLLLVPTSQNEVSRIFRNVQLPWLQAAGLITAIFIFVAPRAKSLLPMRLLLLLPVLALAGLMYGVMQTTQQPLISFLNIMLPKHDYFASTGFSPLQSLTPAVFLKPSKRSALRIVCRQLPSRYLVGNRLALLDSESMTWQPLNKKQKPFEPLPEALGDGEFKYPLQNHHASETMPATEAAMHIRSFKYEQFIFLPPGAAGVRGHFAELVQNNQNVWTADFKRRSNKTWSIDLDHSRSPDIITRDYLQLPALWDLALTLKSISFAGGSRAETVDNIAAAFAQRSYALQTDFDPEKPFHDFFLNDKPGYCFWFASAAALALRANGIPSRLASGYVIHEYLGAEVWLVRERDAHSWVEWQDTGGYWHTLDPTPAGIASYFNGYRSGAVSRLVHLALAKWNSFFDQILKSALGENTFIAFGLIILGWLFKREYSRISRDRRIEGFSSQQWKKLWVAFLRITQLPNRPSWTAGTYQAHLPQSWPPVKQKLTMVFLERYTRARFSPAGEPPVAELERLLKK
ncbi:MAG: transglutaminase domain-containing protein, partial [Deltaproteobacteria bacterium]|nr:transglutaminase domain-containing protein [Deltaproteobacteria bacterium]